MAERFSIRAEVGTNLPELEKNRLLASAILGPPVAGKPARISPPQKALLEPESILREHNIGEGEYWVVCAGARPGLEIKDWGEANWVAALRQIAPETMSPCSFWATRQRLLRSIEYARLAERFGHFNLAGKPPPILASVGIIALSAGFVGRDSGPMHVAAASRGHFWRFRAAGFGAASFPKPTAQ